jgi:dipeptidyl aminopeptidase/acylaminoacyl peptidase
MTTFPTHHYRVAMLLVALLWAPAAAAQPANALTPVQIGQIEIVTSAAITPDGRHIAYTVAVPADPFEQNAPSALHLYVVDTQTGQSTPLHTAGSVGGITVRPGHGTVTFLATLDRENGRSLFEVPITGGTPRLLVTHETNIIGYEWNPDGRRVAFIANEPTRDPATPLPYRPQFYEENLAQRRAFIADVVAGGASQEIPHEGSFYQLVWSPAGDRLAVSVAPTPMVDDMYMAQAVKVLDGTKGRLLSEIDNRGKLAQITWSPDGQRLALRAADHIHDPIDGRIMVVSAEGGTPQNIFRDFEGKFEHIAWTADDTIHFVASESTAKTFGTIRPDGTGFSRIVSNDVDLGGFMRADDGTTVFVASSVEHPAEVFVLRPGVTTLARLTNSNPWVDAIPKGEQRVVTWTARDGAFDIDGLLILPVHYTQGTRVPVITVVHGGPEAHYSRGWLTNYSVPGQLAAGRGYAVFYPNYRGSTGRGLEFIMSSQADLAGAEFDDIVDGIDYLIAQGIADPDRIGVTGGSYGGYATAWMTTRYSDRFAAGVMFVGISNNLSKWGTSDIPDELYLVHSRERLWESDAKWMDYLRRSPIYHVENAQTPLLIMHGAEDTRVHPAQSLELYRHLRVRRPDVPVRLIFYPGEGHGNVRAASRLDYTLRMVEWFDTYLMGDGEMPGLDILMPAAQIGAAVGAN